MTIFELYAHLYYGREIEFRLDERRFFASKVFNNNKCDMFYIYDEEEKKIITQGDLNTILNFKFSDSKSLFENIEDFVFDCIL